MRRSWGYVPDDPVDSGLMPREIWLSVLELVHASSSLRAVVRLATVSSLWRELVFESVTALGDGNASLQELKDDELARLSRLRRLNLSDCYFISDAGVTGLLNLTSFQLGPQNRVSGRGIGMLVNLTSLDLCGHYGCGRIDGDGLTGLYNLTTLSVRCRQIENRHISCLTSLLTLDLTANRTVTDDGISGLLKLTSLDLCDNGLISDHCVSRLTNLTLLNLRQNLQVTDDALRPLVKLQTLLLRWNRLITGAAIRHLDLTCLDISNNRYFVNADIQHLTSLTSLSVEPDAMAAADSRYCTMISDEAFGNFVNLTRLSIGLNQVIKSGIGLLRNLTSLSLAENASVPSEALMKLDNLTSLDISFNESITNAGICGLTRLATLNLCGNEKISEIAGLTNLVWLSLAGQRKVTAIASDQLKGLTKLTYLDLYQNALIDDVGIQDLTSLTSLNLISSPFITAAGISKLVNLATLRFRNKSVFQSRCLQGLTNLTDLEDCEPSVRHRALVAKSSEYFKKL